MAALAALPAWVAPAAIGAVTGGAISQASRKKSSSSAEPAIDETQQRAEARAEAQTREEAARMAARGRARRSGGLRLLMSPARQEGPQAGTRTTLGPGG